MKVGSLVEKVNNNVSHWANVLSYKVPVPGKIYTVRDIIIYLKGTGILLEEIVNKKVPIRSCKTGSVYHAEMAFDIENFRELMPPTSISIEDILKEESYERI